MRPYRDPTTGEYVAEHETRETDGTVRRTTEWFESENAARAYVRDGKIDTLSDDVQPGAESERG